MHYRHKPLNTFSLTLTQSPGGEVMTKDVRFLDVLPEVVQVVLSSQVSVTLQLVNEFDDL